MYVYEDTFSARYKWHNIGLCLMLEPSTLNAIAADFNAVEERHCQSLEEWLKTGSATMMKLINALKNVIVHENQLAQDLEAKYSKKGESKEGKTYTDIYVYEPIQFTIRDLIPPLQFHSVLKQWKC